MLCQLPFFFVWQVALICQNSKQYVPPRAVAVMVGDRADSPKLNEPTYWEDGRAGETHLTGDLNLSARARVSKDII